MKRTSGRGAKRRIVTGASLFKQSKLKNRNFEHLLVLIQSLKATLDQIRIKLIMSGEFALFAV
jgi:hypothetical protein